MLLPVIVVVSLCLFQNVNCDFGTNKQSYGFVDTREGAHMFYWLFYTTADVPNYTQRPLVVWLQGGPGGSSTGIGNFEILGPLDLSLQPRNYTWVNDFNVLFLDNPVGTGFSYVDDLSYLTTDNEQIADDFVAFMRGFYLKHPEFEGVPLYIYGQSYGGKMAVDMAIKMKEAEAASTINSNLRGIAMGNAWIHPVNLTSTWGPLLLAAGLVDQAGHDAIQDQALMAERLFEEGRFEESTAQWARTQSEVFARTGNVDFYNILTKMPNRRTGRDARSDIALTRDMLITSRHYGASRQEWDLYQLMNTQVAPALGVPAHVVWDSQSNAVFNYLRGDFMKPVTDGIEKLLNETDIIVMKYNGNLDLICDTPGQLMWVDRLQWSGAEQFSRAAREPVWEDGRLEGYYQSYGNFRFFYINVAGHSVPRDNPQGSKAFLRDMTSFG
ncbi:unnamed protein product [Plutella xylostella]|uniref:Retinoid-inducible serine carboxypeptidase n=1 Tax=Plutella xylostella TaxID=51655 RepID=A0A8S4FSY4_PLUXY|nr:unnamed protein product [Plutella xylostella]